MYDLVHWLAMHLVETSKTVQKLDQAFQSIEQGDKFGCMYALTEPIDDLEIQGTELPNKYQEIVDQVCQEAIDLIYKSHDIKQSGGNPAIALPAGAIVGIAGAGVVVLAFIVWAIVRARLRSKGSATQLPTTIETQADPFARAVDPRSDAERLAAKQEYIKERSRLQTLDVIQRGESGSDGDLSEEQEYQLAMQKSHDVNRAMAERLGVYHHGKVQ